MDYSRTEVAAAARK